MKDSNRLCAVFSALALGSAAQAQEAVKPFTLENRLDEVALRRRDVAYGCADGTQNCWSEEARQAQRLREFKLVMMAGMFSCEAKAEKGELRRQFGTFVENNKEVLAASFETVRAEFRLSSPDDRAAMLKQDSLDTAIGNLYSTTDCETFMPYLVKMTAVTDPKALTAEVNRLIPPPAP